MRQLFHWLGLVLTALCLVAGVAVVGLWRSQQAQLLSVQSGSMAPLLQPGDAVLVRKPGTVAIQRGDLVSYRSPLDARLIVTHRVVSVDSRTGQLLTKGDANVTADPPVDQAAVSGVVRYRLPAVGRLIDLLHSWTGLVVMIYIPAALILIREVIRLTHHYLRPTYQLRY